MGIHDLHKELRLGYQRSWNLDHLPNRTDTTNGHDVRSQVPDRLQGGRGYDR